MAVILAVILRKLLRPVLNALLYFPSRDVVVRPRAPFEDVEIATEDGERLHGWWVPATGEPRRAPVLLLHGNAGNIGDRAAHVDLLAAAGFDVLAFDYRGYGRSSGRPDEQGTYRDAWAALAELKRRHGVRPARVVYLGESLGGAIALELALRSPPAGLILQSTFTSIRDMARLHYPYVPRVAVPDAYPSLRLVTDLRAPLLCLHGDRDEVVPLMYGEALFEAAPEPKAMHVFRGVAHNDMLTHAGREWVGVIARWAAQQAGA
jgi:pimeloyl-ACP methyl ester carboxylesterase